MILQLVKIDRLICQDIIKKKIIMNLGIEGKKVIITGASQGIGLEIAELFSLEGASVTIISSNEKKLDKAFKTINKKSKKNKTF